MSTITTDTHNFTMLEDGVADQIIDLVADRLHAEDGVTIASLQDWKIAHPKIINAILVNFLASGLWMLVDGAIHHTRLVEYV